MPLHVLSRDWLPAGGITLENNADTVVRSHSNYLVVAGPGAGKTELLAQRACYLLQTNLCPEPRRILAISFKHDAAVNLGTRVGARCGAELASRFDSRTFDAFAKSLVDRFREGLPETYRPPRDYKVETNDNVLIELVRDLRAQPVQAQSQHPDPESLRALDPYYVLKRLLCSYPLSVLSAPTDRSHHNAAEMWLRLMQRPGCTINFDMVKRLAAYLIDKNPLLQRALWSTYSHVFLDEFQDTTSIQFDLLCTCFIGSQAVVTAVGDNKQRIMLWAGAMPDAFRQFTKSFEPTPLPLLSNYRSDKELVRIQQCLVNSMEPEAKPAVPSKSNMVGDGVCEILLFPEGQQEAARVTDMICSLIKSGVKPHEICLLARKKVDESCEPILSQLRSRGVKCRVDSEYQDVLGDELISTYLSMLRLATGGCCREEWAHMVDLCCALAGDDSMNEHESYAQEDRLSAFLAELRAKMPVLPADKKAMCALLASIQGFLGLRALRAYFPRHQNPNSYKYIIRKFARLLWDVCERGQSWEQVLDEFEGRDTLPAMTIHKSKGLEYHTVFFIGLEDRAWYNFAKEKEENTCAFFVAFSRAEKQVYFTFCESRREDAEGRPVAESRRQINSLYALLHSAGVGEKWS